MCSLMHAQDTLFTTYPNSNQTWEKIYMDGKIYKENIYHKNDEQWMTVQYEDSEIENWNWYYDNGNPYFRATIQNELLQGTYTIWYENGQVAEELIFVDNIEEGPAMFYYENGQLASTGNYSKGQMVGDWQFFDNTGQPFTGFWEWNFAASQNNARMQGKVSQGKPYGNWKYLSTANQGKASQIQFEHVLE